MNATSGFLRWCAALAAAAVAFVVLTPALCSGGEDEPTTCRSAVLLHLPWMESEGLALGIALVAAVAAYLVVRRLLPPAR